MEILEVNAIHHWTARQFLHLPFRLYANVTQWVPPLLHEAQRMLDRRRNPFFRHGRAIFLLAIHDGQARGRLAVLINDLYNQYNRETTAFIYLFECENDLQVAEALFAAGKDWAKSQGMSRLVGPKGFTVFDGIGLLTRGFEHRPAFGLPYNPPYYPELLEKVGFVRERELLSGYLDERIQFPARIHEVAELLKKRRGLHVARYHNWQELRALIPHLKQLYNNALSGTQGNAPLTDEDVKGLADQMLWFADPSLIKIVMKGDQPVGFLLAHPDVSAAVQRIRGQVFPLGWVALWRELRRTRWININGAGMIEGYRGLGGTALLFSEMYKTVVESRYRFADIVQVGVENVNMLREMRDLGIDFYKEHCLYCCEL